VGKRLVRNRHGNPGMMRPIEGYGRYAYDSDDKPEEDAKHLVVESPLLNIVDDFL
jgi:hypothetical protein